MAARALDLKGQQYGFLSVVNFAGISTGSRPERLWLCKCKCGAEITVRQNNLRSNHTKSCGCHMKQTSAIINRKHGYTKTPTYIAWANMKGRCLNKNNKNYLNYGDRGITVCAKWLNSFQAFIDDMGEKPGKGYSIERIDVNGNYEPSNCKWATTAEQNRNYRRNIYIEYNGRTQCLKDWATELGMCPSVLRYRIKAGWSVDDAFKIPVTMKNKPMHRQQ